MRKVTVGLVQMESIPGDKESNLAVAVRLTRDAASRGADIVCLPEMFVTGYYLDHFGHYLYDISEDLNGQTVQKIQELARELNLYIIAPLALRRGKTVINTAVLITDRGEIQGVYCKNHLFGDEDRHFATMGEYPVFSTKYGDIGIMICCDNNYPEPARILALQGAELIFTTAAWRIQEADLWQLYNSCRAAENNVFIAGVNAYGKTENLFLFGHSMLVNPRGKIVTEATEDGNSVLVETINLEEVDGMRQSGPGLRGRHPSQYKALSQPVNIRGTLAKLVR